MTHGVWTGPISFVPASKSMRVWSPRLGKGLLLITRVYSKLRSEVSRIEVALVRPFPLNMSWSGKPMTTDQHTTPCVLWYESGLFCLRPKDIDHCLWKSTGPDNASFVALSGIQISLLYSAAQNSKQKITQTLLAFCYKVRLNLATRPKNPWYMQTYNGLLKSTHYQFDRFSITTAPVYSLFVWTAL